MLAARHITITAMVTVKAAIKGNPSSASDGTFISRKAVIQAITTPKMLQVIVPLKAASFAPSAKYAAQGIVAAQMKKYPLSGPTAKNVAAPAKMPILKESAVSRLIV